MTRGGRAVTSGRSRGSAAPETPANKQRWLSCRPSHGRAARDLQGSPTIYEVASAARADPMVGALLSIPNAAVCRREYNTGC